MTSINILCLYIGGNQTKSIGLLDIFGIIFFVFGSFINTYSEYQRYKWKQNPKNAGHLYTQGLFQY
ncbi:MAG: DUF1295 domain-containing protein [Dehalococcoidia bacterium]|nr:MAG: DUF1295 domain-containing protein [Dehalococcoidia bacterium]